jgi:hypothetical protein
VKRFQAAIEPYKLGDVLTLALWQCPPWMIVGYFGYEWRIVHADLTYSTCCLFLAAFTLARGFCRLMRFCVVRGMPLQHHLR